MKKYIILLLGVLGLERAQAQTVGEVFVNQANTAHEIWWNKSLREQSKWSFFNYSRFRVNYQSSRKNEFLSYSTLNYEIGKGFGIAGGGFVTNFGFSPVIAANYFYQNSTWFVNIFPSVELKKQPNLELFVFLQYRPRLNEKWRIFSQLILNSNFTFQKHNFSEQNLRLGLDYQSYQFGLGSDLSQLPHQTSENSQVLFNFNYGLFLRKEF
jgi:hypothetical protein